MTNENEPMNSSSDAATAPKALNNGPNAKTPCSDANLRLVANNRPPPGMAWNPLKTLPRNLPCPCRSGAKFKTCCQPKLPMFVNAREAKIYSESIKAGRDIFFNQVP